MRYQVWGCGRMMSEWDTEEGAKREAAWQKKHWRERFGVTREFDIRPVPERQVPPDKLVFAVAVLGTRVQCGAFEFRQCVYIVDAQSHGEASEKARRECRSELPECDGWELSTCCCCQTMKED